MSVIAAAFAHGLHALAQRPLPANVAREAQRSLINVIGTSIGASRHPGVDAILAAARDLGVAPRAPVPGRTERVDVHFSALATGFAAHLDDFDDTHLATVIHPAASVLAVITALAPETRPTGRAALSAFALGCEAQLRVGVSISPEHYDRGWHITGTCGVVGCATTAALLLGLNEAQLTQAVANAASMFVGQREAFGTMTKPYHPGKAAANGIAAARLALAGQQAAGDIFEAAGGYSHSMSTRVDFEQMNGAFGERWELLFNTYKPYPCGIVAHPAIDAGLALAPRIDHAEDIETITLRCHPLVPELMGNPQPKDGLQARFSAIHGVAAALCDKRVGLAQYEDARVVQDDVRRVRALTTLAPDAAVNRDEVFIRATLKRGDVLEHHVEHARGSLARPLTDAELMDKVRLLIDPLLGDGIAASLATAVETIDAAPSLDTLFALCAPQEELNDA
ncbi:MULTISPECIES: MmgE/PrpD family protein [Paraburkholderia]|uniref:2-methylcitrate dehydratase PrpD n=1 Tax=Paraburkholderia tropica TaxID=92647 RepID=A0ABX5MLS5_9BURK|nr:MmgE/PrpD family protein [Paraburkholderia tropica]MDE1138295.1 MmgE/PrpD family protein [Paraburkholderia tropica]PXX11687.1 2-methylcitrate dehydratase PrpD [Paraburkholderia tropica]PZW77096.1 2-methylcitrate dehydratase PrpD [Paraburkholderia tropica]